MDIALLMGEVAFITYKKMIDGIIEQAKKENVNVFLFTCEGWHYDQDLSYVKGEYNIYHLPDLRRFAGVIVDMVTIHHEETAAMISRKIKECDVPAVAINIPLDTNRSGLVRLENVDGIHRTIEHLMKVHHVQKIHYLSGPKYNQDAEERLQSFRLTMEQYGLTYGEEDISYGDFEYSSGQVFAKRIIKGEIPMPQAIVAANDFMAIGAMETLQKAGYQIPEDVIVTGYDGGAMSGYVQPPLSTVKRDEYKAGKCAYKALKKLIAGKTVKEQVIEGENIFRPSCGCDEKVHRHKSELIMELAEEKIYYDNNLETLKAITVNFSNLNSFSDFTLHLQKAVDGMGLESFYLCLCGNREQYFHEIDLITQGEELSRDETAYMEFGTIPLAYERGQWTSYNEFRMADILPGECMDKKDGIYYIVMPIHYRELCIGYCVVGNDHEKVEQRFIQHLVLNINNALGEIREYEIMQTMFANINEKWMYDELTGIYNRTGLKKMEKAFLKYVRKNHRKIVVYFIDLDGLKRINDQFGHEEGDCYIKSMAGILTQIDHQGDVISRFGGDEYVILSSYETEDEIDTYLQLIEREIQKYNESGAKHKLSASIGYEIQENVQNISFKEMIEEADKKMYICKKEKKAAKQV